MDLRIVMLALSAGIVLYAYLLYPLALLLRRRRFAVAPTEAPSCPWPPPDISITLPAYNARNTIRPVLDALVASEYPAAQRQILVVSDASDDGTDAIVGEYASRGVELLRVEGRLGKTAVENAAFASLRGTIIVNTDASVLVHPFALQHLVRAMQDPGVGVASGRDISVATQGSRADSGESTFVGYEMWVRALESDTGGIVGASGCLYAIRSALHRRNLPGHLSRDFASALWARLHGLRAVSVTAALCSVPRAADLRVEFRRKVRTMSRGLQTLLYHGELLDPRRHGEFAWKLWSHKLIRWAVPVAVTVGAIALVALGGAAPVLVVLALAAAGWWWPPQRRTPTPFAKAAYLVSGVLAGLLAWWRALRGIDAAVWEPTPRRVAASTSASVRASVDAPASG